MPDIAVIISVRNAAQTIVQCLTAVKKSEGVSCELIVVDAASTDGTAALVVPFTDQLYTVSADIARNKARSLGASYAQAPLVVNIDADVLVKPDTLRIVRNYFDRHPEVDAITGMLSKDHPNRDFLSQYKNLYMHYMFLSLPERVYFLYGSLYAFRRELAGFYDCAYELGEDTAFGQRLSKEGKHIAFLKEAEVEHLKKYSFSGFLKNEFLIPFYWAQIFFAYQGWRQMMRDRGTFSHASGSQMAGILLAVATMVFCAAGFIDPALWGGCLFFFFLWGIAQRSFLAFYYRQRGFCFLALALITALVDDCIKAAGIAAGSVWYLVKKAKK